MKKTSLWLLLLVVFLACQNTNEKFPIPDSALEIPEDFEVEPPRTAEPPPPPPVPEESEENKVIRNSIEKASKIIKDGRMVVAVNNLKATKAKIDSSLIKFKAYYENKDYQAQTYRSTYQLDIRIPAKDFENFIKNIESGKGKILQKNIAARDVTSQYVDVAIRLNNNKNYLNQYRTLLKKANSIKDILAIQEKIRVIEEEIDSRSGRLKYIDDQVRFSTLRLELFEEHEVVRAREVRNFGAQIIAAFKGGFDAFLDFLLFLVRIWPFVLIFGLVWTFRKKINLRFWRKD